MERYIVTAWHGESRSLFYVCDSSAPDGEQPAIVRSFRKRSDADSFANYKNAAHARRIIREAPHA